jgi:hypothetical protein
MKMHNSSMKLIFFIMIFLILFVSPLAAHEATVPLEQGEFQAAAYWMAMCSASYDKMFFFPDASMSNPDKVLFYPITGQYQMSYGGDIESIEYGITDWLSAGIRLGLIDFAVMGIRDAAWRLHASAFVRGQILDKDKLKIHASLETWFSPLFSVPQINWIGDGFVNVIASASFSTPLLETESGHRLFVFIDPMYITSIIGVMELPYNLTLESMIDLPAEQLENTELFFTNVHRIAISTGFDYSYKNWTVSLGIALPLYDFVCHPLRKTVTDYIREGRVFDGFSLSNLMFNWGYRFHP